MAYYASLHIFNVQTVQIKIDYKSIVDWEASCEFRDLHFLVNW